MSIPKARDRVTPGRWRPLAGDARRGHRSARSVGRGHLVGWPACAGRRDRRPRSRRPPPTLVTLTAAAMRDAGVAVAAASTIQRADSLSANAVLALDERRTARVGVAGRGRRCRDLQRGGRSRAAGGRYWRTSTATSCTTRGRSIARPSPSGRRAENGGGLRADGAERAERLLADKAISSAGHASARSPTACRPTSSWTSPARRCVGPRRRSSTSASPTRRTPPARAASRFPARAPFAGVVLERLVTTGTAVTPGTTLFVVSDLSSLWALAEVDETALARVAPNRPVHVRVSAYPDETFEGRVTFVGDTVNPKTRRDGGPLRGAQSRRPPQARDVRDGHARHRRSRVAPWSRSRPRPCRR